jgi:hypothetical protein
VSSDSYRNTATVGYFVELLSKRIVTLEMTIFFIRIQNKMYDNLRSQFGTSSWGGIRYMSYAFTEQGVAMLSGVLKSAVAIQVHIQIIRVFTKMKELLLTHKDILLKLETLENDVTENKKDIAMIFKAVKQLLNPPVTPRKRIGFKPDD